MIRRAFRAMGTDVELLLDAPRGDAALVAAEAEFHRLEKLLSRFRPDSELSRLNAEGSIEAGPDLVRVVRLALDAREATMDVSTRPSTTRSSPPATTARSTRLRQTVRTRAPPCGGRIAIHGNRIELEPGVRIDLGGIAKGDAVERAADLLRPPACLVNAGGTSPCAAGAGRWPWST